MSNQSMGAAKPGAPELVAAGLGWPEGPTVIRWFSSIPIGRS
jgi:hypothetical protein